MQKKILAFHDLAGFGRSSLVPIISTLSAMGHQCVPIPTAMFSTHTAISGYVLHDLTEDLSAWISQYAALSLQFDAIYSGFLSSTAQIDAVGHALQKLRVPSGIVLVDPVMGDDGKIYCTYTPELCARMGELCKAADYMTPNPTEAAVLLGRHPEQQARSLADACADACALSQQYQAQVILTGLPLGTAQLGIVCCADGIVQHFTHPRTPIYYPGTGDLFASIVLGALLRGQSLLSAARCAADFVQQCVTYTAAQQTQPMYGVLFETQLPRLWAHPAD